MQETGSVGTPRASISKEAKVNNWQKYQYDQGSRMCIGMAVPSIPVLNVVTYSFSPVHHGCLAIDYSPKLRDASST